MSNYRTLPLIGSALLALATSGCAQWEALTQPPSRADAEFGQAARQAWALQTLNPQAGKANTAAAPTDAQALRNALSRQRESFKSSEKSD